MAINDAIVWIYLGRRDKSGIKIISKFNGKKIKVSRIYDLADLQLPIDYHEAISKEIYDNRFLYEPWIESSLSYMELKKQIESRGYYNLPISSVPVYATTYTPPEISFKNIQQTTTMIRKLS